MGSTVANAKRFGQRSLYSLPRPLRHRYWLAIITALAVSVFGFGQTLARGAEAVAPAPDGHSASSCPDVLFIGARGSGESEAGFNGMGPDVDRMATVLNERLATHGLLMRTFPDLYSADSVGDLIPSKAEMAELGAAGAVAPAIYDRRNVAKYLESIATGVADALAAIRQTVAACPRTSLVLAGYSQGAMVMHQAELKLAASPTAGLMSHVVGTLLLGDGDRTPDTHADSFGTSPRSGEGVFNYLSGVVHHARVSDVPLPASTANICDADDIVCDFGIRHFDSLGAIKHAAEVHTTYAQRTANGSYNYSPLLADAARWLGARLSHLIPLRQPPTLGLVWGGPSQQGYGSVAPSTIFNGGDPTGYVGHVTWVSWGSGEAIGHGTGDYVWPGFDVASGSTRAAATVVAYDLGTCNGQPAYQKIEWYFPGYGDTFDPREYINDCTGHYSPYEPKVENCANVELTSRAAIATNISAVDINCASARRLIANSPSTRYLLHGGRWRYAGYWCGSQHPADSTGPPWLYGCERGERSMIYSLSPQATSP